MKPTAPKNQNRTAQRIARRKISQAPSERIHKEHQISPNTTTQPAPAPPTAGPYRNDPRKSGQRFGVMSVIFRGAPEGARGQHRHFGKIWGRARSTAPALPTTEAAITFDLTRRADASLGPSDRAIQYGDDTGVENPPAIPTDTARPDARDLISAEQQNIMAIQEKDNAQKSDSRKS